jgi:hypothetical protein
VVAVGWAVQDDEVLDRWNLHGGGVSKGQGLISGVIVVDRTWVEGRVDGAGVGVPWSEDEYPPQRSHSATHRAQWRSAPDVWRVRTERSLFAALCWLVRRWDPDIVVGFEIQRGSLGFLADRATVLGLPNLFVRLSRVPAGRPHPRHESDSYGDEHASGLWMTGRHLLNLWRILRKEIKLPRYARGNLTLAVLGRRFPDFEPHTLTRWLVGQGAYPVIRSVPAATTVSAGNSSSSSSSSSSAAAAAAMSTVPRVDEESVPMDTQELGVEEGMVEEEEEEEGRGRATRRMPSAPIRPGIWK